MDWVYFARGTKASLPSTLAAARDRLVLWRSLLNRSGRTVANVSRLAVGDTIYLAWRATNAVYLKCSVAAPLDPVRPDSVIDRIRPEHGAELVRAGYDSTETGHVEVIQLAQVEECYFPLTRNYARNALQKLDPRDLACVARAAPLPLHALHEKVKSRNAARPRVTRPERSRTPIQYATAQTPVDRVVVEGKGKERAFDSYIMVDWSSSSSRVTGNDSIWIASGAWSGSGFSAGAPENLATRHLAVQRIRELASELRRDRRVLVGLDFAFGYPAGFVSALGLKTNGAPWLTLHGHFSSHVSDSETNRHNRDTFAAECNGRIAPEGPGPFWGCSQRAESRNLTQRRVGVFTFPYSDNGLQEWRLTERRCARIAPPQSVWKLNCGVSLGGQTILGIKHLHELAEALGGHRWPFETGWTTPAPGTATVWFAEIFPSLIRYPEWDSEYDARRDRTQVQSCVRHAAELDADGSLRNAFAKPPDLTPAELERVATEEGWILFA